MRLRNAIKFASMGSILAGLPAIAIAATPALPAGGTFQQGAGSISTSGSTETVTITRPSAIINWSGGYDVGKGHTISYAAGSGFTPVAGTGNVVVNIDNSGNPSSIDGTIKSPGFAQVLVNPNGISVGTSATLPGAFEFAAGTFNRTSNQITASTAPVTIAPGVTISSSKPIQDVSTIGITATSGDTLPATRGMSQVNVTVPAGSTPTFTLGAGEVGDWNFAGQYSSSGPSAPANVTIQGPADGSQVGHVYATEAFQATQSGTLDNDTGTLTIKNVNSAGSINASSGQGITLSGTVSAMNGISAVAETAAGGGGSLYGSAGQTATLTVAPGTMLASSSGQLDLTGGEVTIGKGVEAHAGTASFDAYNSISGGSGGSITDPVKGSTISLRAESIKNVSATDSTGTVTAGAGTISGGTISGDSVWLSGGPSTSGVTVDGTTATAPSITVQDPAGVTIGAGTTLTAPGGAGLIKLSATNGNVVVDSGATVTADPAGGCTTDGDCDTSITGNAVDFKTGNKITAADQNLESGTVSGTANASLSESATGTWTGQGILIDAGKTATIGGTLDAGNPPSQPVTPPTGGNGGSAPVTTPTQPSKPAATKSVVAPAPKPAPKKIAAPAPKAPKPVAPTIHIVAPTQIRPSESVTTVEQTGSTVLVPESGPSAGSAVTIEPAAGSKESVGNQPQHRRR